MRSLLNLLVHAKFVEFLLVRVKFVEFLLVRVKFVEDGLASLQSLMLHRYIHFL